MPLDRNGIAKRAAQEVRDGMYVNLGREALDRTLRYNARFAESQKQRGSTQACGFA